jgi:hypothetical protein
MLQRSWQSLAVPLLAPVVALFAFRGQPHDLGEVALHPRFRTVDEDTGLSVFVGLRVLAPAADRLLGAVPALVGPVKAAKRDAAEARVTGDWDTVHEIELVLGEETMRMDGAEFGQFLSDARSRKVRDRPAIIAPSRR